MPVLAILLVWLHVRVAPRVLPLGASSVRLAGTVLGRPRWSCAAWGSSCTTRAQETGIVRGPHGTIRATPADASAYQQAVDVVLRRTRRSEPILLAPQMTSLYVLTGRQDVLDELSLLPGRARDGRPTSGRRSARSTTAACAWRSPTGPRWRATAAAPSASATTGCSAPGCAATSPA